MDRDEIEARLDEQPMASRMRVLIVDDEEDIRRLLREALADCDSLEASGGEEALETLQQESPDLVITDIRMPGTDGLTLLAKVKERFPNLPVLGISGMVNDDDIHEYGFDAFMEKPMDLRELRELVDQTVEKDSV